MSCYVIFYYFFNKQQYKNKIVKSGKKIKLKKIFSLKLNIEFYSTYDIYNRRSD